MSELLCEIQSQNGSSQNTPVFTVGELFDLKCKGESISLNPDQVKIKLEKNSYALKILKAETSPQGDWIFHVVSYQVGDYSKEEQLFEVTDGVNSLTLKNIRFQVNSVQDPQNPQKEPFGPYGPFVTPFPWIAIYILIGIVSLSLLFGILKWWRRRKVKAQWNRMKSYDKPISPSTEYYGIIRKLERQIDFEFKFKLTPEQVQNLSQELANAFKIFIVRQFQIPATELNAKDIIELYKIKWSWKGSEHVHNLAVLLNEMSKIKKNSNFTVQDLVQLLKSSKKWVDYSLSQNKGGG